MHPFFNKILDKTWYRLTRALGNLVRLYHPRNLRERGLSWAVTTLAVTMVLVMMVLSWYWSREPAMFDVRQATIALLKDKNATPVTGQYSTATLITIAETLLNKPGGYLSNDVAPPTVFLDNMPNWEFGALVQVRDFAKALRNDMSRSQSQSLEDPDLAEAEPHFNFANDSWLFPPSEYEYRKGIKNLRHYFYRLGTGGKDGAQFYARADNLQDWLAVVNKRLGSLALRLSASVGTARVNTNLAGDTAAQQSSTEPQTILVKTPWTKIDDVFYEARGSTWALIHLLKAVDIDFAGVLKKKNAQVSLKQIIRELEATQEPVWSPVILNGSGFGFVTNHSLVMASYISRANAALIDLRNLLQQG